MKARVERDVDRWIRELREAGWEPYRGSQTRWQAPNGALYLGPYGAWKVMRGGRT